MVDSLNAEISLGTVANSHEAVRWLGYTYLFVRMRKNPFQYGLNFLFRLEPCLMFVQVSRAMHQLMILN